MRVSVRMPSPPWAGIAALTGLILDPLNLIGIAGIVVALIYLFEVKPRIQQIIRR